MDAHTSLLWESKFHKVIKNKDKSLTILSAAEDGVVFGHMKQLAALTKGFSKSVSVFTETVDLRDADPDTGINFGSLEADTVTLSASRVLTKGNAVISARGADGTPNLTTGSQNRADTDGKQGNTLNVFIANASSQQFPIKFDARGGDGATTKEIKHAAGTGGKGGSARVLVVSAWAQISKTLDELWKTVQPENPPPPAFPWDKPVKDNDNEELLPETHEIFDQIVGIQDVIELLVPDDDPVVKNVLTHLDALSQPGKRLTRMAIVAGLGHVINVIEQALNAQESRLGYSVKANGGSGGSAALDQGRRGTRGQDGTPGVAESTFVQALPLYTPPGFAPLHPLQCQMMLDKADALFYFGDVGSLKAAKKILARLVVKIGSVFGLDSVDGDKGLSEEAKEAKKKRIEALEVVYEAQRESIGIPETMKAPVQRLRQISREAMAMLYKITQTSVDYNGLQRNWAPRLSARRLDEDTEKSITALVEAEGLYLKFANEKERVETRQQMREMTLAQAETGTRNTRTELETLEALLSDLRRRITSLSLVNELRRRGDVLAWELEALKAGVEDSFFDLSQQRIMQSIGNVAKSTPITDLFKKVEKPKTDDGKGDGKGNGKGDGKGNGKGDGSGGKDEGDKGGAKNEDEKPEQQPGTSSDSNKETDDPNTPSTSGTVAVNINHSPGQSTSNTSDGSQTTTTEDNTKPAGDNTKPTEPSKKPDKKGFLGLDLDVSGFTGKILSAGAKEGASLIWDGLTTIPGESGETVDKSLVVGRIERAAGDLAKAIKNNEANVKEDPESGIFSVEEKQDKLLVASQAQIDKFAKELVNAKVGPQAVKVQQALVAYMDLLTGRNHDKMQYNMALKRLVELRSKLHTLDERRKEAQIEAVNDPDVKQLDQFAQMTEDIYQWTRVRTMRLISLYRRAIYFTELIDPVPYKDDMPIGDAALSLSAVQLRFMQQKLSSMLFDYQEKAGSDPSRFPSRFDDDRGKFAELTPQQLDTLLDEKEVRVTLPAPSLTYSTLPEFRGRANVRAYRVHFWLEGLSLKDEAAGTEDGVIANISLTHVGDSIFYDCRGVPHVFVHDPIQPGWSYRVFPRKNERGRSPRPADSGDIVNYHSIKPEENTAYSAPSPFATWIISLRYLNTEWLDISGVRKGRFEIFGTSRDFEN